MYRIRADADTLGWNVTLGFMLWCHMVSELGHFSITHCTHNLLRDFVHRFLITASCYYFINEEIGFKFLDLHALKTQQIHRC